MLLWKTQILRDNRRSTSSDISTILRLRGSGRPWSGYRVPQKCHPYMVPTVSRLFRRGCLGTVGDVSIGYGVVVQRRRGNL